jgi:hypothetical protein
MVRVGTEVGVALRVRVGGMVFDGLGVALGSGDFVGVRVGEGDGVAVGGLVAVAVNVGSRVGEPTAADTVGSGDAVSAGVSRGVAVSPVGVAVEVRSSCVGEGEGLNSNGLAVGVGRGLPCSLGVGVSEEVASGLGLCGAFSVGLGEGVTSLLRVAVGVRTSPVDEGLAVLWTTVGDETEGDGDGLGSGVSDEVGVNGGITAAVRRYATRSATLARPSRFGSSPVHGTAAPNNQRTISPTAPVGSPHSGAARAIPVRQATARLRHRTPHRLAS